MTIVQRVEAQLKAKSAYQTCATLCKIIKKDRQRIRESLKLLEAEGKLDVIHVFTGTKEEKAYLHEEAIFD